MFIKKARSALLFSLALAVTQTAGISVASVGSSYQFHPPAPWEKANLPEADSSWIIKGSASKASITVTTDHTPEAIDFKKADETVIMDGVEFTRSLAFGLFGISNWKVEKHKLTVLEHGALIQMEGHYKATSGTPVHFVERDYYSGKNSYTVTFFEDVNGTPLQSESGIQSLLDSFKVTGDGG